MDEQELFNFSRIITELEDSLLRFEISVNNLMTMTVFDSADDLLKESSSFIFWHSTSIHNVLKEFSSSILSETKSNQSEFRQDHKSEKGEKRR